MSKPNKKSSPLKLIIVLIICVIIFILCYKVLLLINLKEANKIIDSFDIVTSKIEDNYNITYDGEEDVFKYKNIYLPKLSNLCEISYGEENNPVYTCDEKKIAVSKSEFILNDLNLGGVEKYLQKEKIVSENDVYTFITNFKVKKVNIFTSISNLKRELFRRNFYSIAYTNYKVFYKLSGDYQGNILIYDKLTHVSLFDGDDIYEFIFTEDFSLDEIKLIIQKVSFSK